MDDLVLENQYGGLFQPTAIAVQSMKKLID